jgi:DNA-binding Lrp family transcriptional regulator
MDKQILKILERDARTSSAQMAVMLGKTEEEIEKSIKEMEEAGIIRHYKAIIDWEKAGKEHVFAFIDVRVSPSRGVGFDDVARRVYKYPEVHSVYLVSGDYDLRVVVEGKTMRDVAFFVAEKLSTLEGVLSTKSSFLLKKYKMDGDIFEEPAAVEDRLAVAP